ncbi:MAG TPA: glycosyltransferase [Holophagaceae bacterium]|nr:glycosyltransferase [Holophagaceae bacterium]
MPRPLVSIVIASYNYGRFLDEAIRSALAQTHQPVEVIVVDDGSQDDSVSVAKAHPVRLITQANQGVSAARNVGARAAGGAFLVFLDADDALEPEYVECCLRTLQAAPLEVAYAYTGMRYFGSETGLFESRPFDPKALGEGNYIHAAALLRREAFEAVGGFDPAWREGLEDYELWVRMLDRGYRGVLVPEPLLRYRRHGPSRNLMSGSTQKVLRWRMRLAYPRVFWRKLLKDPLRSLYFLLWLRLRRGKG